MPNIVLANQGDSAVIPQSGLNLSEYVEGKTKLRAVLEWNAAVDLDIHAFYRPRGGGKDGHVFFGSKGKKNKKPYIHLDKDMGVGNVGGDNREIITIGALGEVELILIVTNIFRVFGFLAEDDNFARYDGSVSIITSLNDEVEVPLTSDVAGRWCVIALIDNSDPESPVVTNINRVVREEPKIDDYLDDGVLELTYDD